MKKLEYLVSGRLAFLMTREQVTLDEGDDLTVAADAEEGSTLCLVAEDHTPILASMSDGCASVPAALLPEGAIRVLFVKDGCTVDGGTLKLVKIDGRGLILPALMANTLERERFAAMMANILFRLKAAEDQLDLLKNGADIIE